MEGLGKLDGGIEKFVRHDIFLEELKKSTWMISTSTPHIKS